MCHLTLKAFLQPILKIYLDLMTSNIMADFFGQILEQKITFFSRFFTIPREPVNAQKSTLYEIKGQDIIYRWVYSSTLCSE